MRGLGIYSAVDVLNYAFLTSRLHSASLQTKLLRHSGVPLFSVLKPFSACSVVFSGDIYGNHVVSCADIVEIEKDAIVLPKRIQNFSVTQDIRERAAIHIFSRISFAITRRVRAQIGYLAEADSKVLHNSGHWGTCGFSYFNRISFAIAKGVGAQIGKCPMMLGEYIASAPLTPLVKPGGGIRPIAVALSGGFGVGVPGGGEAILHAVNRLVEDRGDDVGLSMLLVDFQNAFNLVDRTVMLEEVHRRCPAISRWVEFCYSSPTRLYYGEHSL
ncbi:hypothetical protein Tco_0887817 [Tanacetum coccineum]